MARSMKQGLLVLGALVVGMAASTADAAVVTHRARAAVVATPVCRPNIAYAHRGTTAVRATPYRPLVGPQVAHHGHTAAVVRR